MSLEFDLRFWLYIYMIFKFMAYQEKTYPGYLTDTASLDLKIHPKKTSDIS